MVAKIKSLKYIKAAFVLLMVLGLISCSEDSEEKKYVDGPEIVHWALFQDNGELKLLDGHSFTVPTGEKTLEIPIVSHGVSSVVILTELKDKFEVECLPCKMVNMDDKSLEDYIFDVESDNEHGWTLNRYSQTIRISRKDATEPIETDVRINMVLIRCCSDVADIKVTFE